MSDLSDLMAMQDRLFQQQSGLSGLLGQGASNISGNAILRQQQQAELNRHRSMQMNGLTFPRSMVKPVEKRNLTLREELQCETDEALKDVLK